MTDFCFKYLMAKVYDDARRQPHISCRHDDVLINPFEVMQLIEEMQKRLNPPTPFSIYSELKPGHLTSSDNSKMPQCDALWSDRIKRVFR